MMALRYFFLGVVLCASAARADTTACPPAQTAASKTHTPEEIATGKALFQKALALQSAKKDDDACEMFESSLRLDPQIGTRLNVADCRERKGKLVEAQALFAEASDEATRVGDRRATFAQKRAFELADKLVRVIVNVAEPATPGILMQIGACPVTTIAASMVQMTVPGNVTVDVSAPGRQPFHVEQQGAAGAVVTIEVPALASDKAAEDARKAKEAEAVAAIEHRKAEQLAADREREQQYNRHPARRWTIVAGAAGGAAVVGGVVFGIMARHSQSAFDAAGCGDRNQLLPAPAYAACTAEADRGQRDALLANTLWIGGAAMVAASALVFAIDPGNVERPDQGAHVAISPTRIELVFAW